MNLFTKRTGVVIPLAIVTITACVVLFLVESHILLKRIIVVISSVYLVTMIIMDNKRRVLERRLSNQSSNYQSVNQDLKNRIWHLETLFEFSEAVSASLNIKALLNLILDSTLRVLNAENGFLILLEGDSVVPEMEIYRGQGGDILREFRGEMREAFIDWVIKRNKPLRVSSSEGHLQFGGSEGYTIGSMICVPLVIGRKSKGVIAILNRLDDSTFSYNELLLLTAIANQAGIAVENAALFEELRKKVRELEMLYEVTTNADALRSMRHTFEVILKSATQLPYIRSGASYTWDAEQKKFLLEQVHGVTRQPFSPKIEVEEKRLNVLLEDGTPGGIQEYLSECISPYLEEDESCYLIVPALFEHELLGTFVLGCDKLAKSLNDSWQLLYVMANQAISCYKRSNSLINAAQLASLGELAARIIHEVRTSLTSTRIYIQELPERYDDPGFKEEFVLVIGEETMRLKELTDEFLKFSRYRSLQLEPGDINYVLDETLLMLKREMAARGVNLLRQYGEDLPEARIDAKRLKEAFLNVMLNSLQAMEGGGQLTLVTGMHSADLLKVEIADTGCGMSSEELQGIFEPFYTTKETGTGLGLPAAKKIISEHGGSVSVTSELNQGTTVSIILPVIATEDEDENSGC